MLNEWDALMNIFTRGDYHLDNNLVERLNRYISLSRRNSLFFGSHAGAKRAAMFYSLACSCRLQGINFFEYISDVINKAAVLPPRTPLSKYRELLPDKWKQKISLKNKNLSDIFLCIYTSIADTLSHKDACHPLSNSNFLHATIAILHDIQSLGWSRQSLTIY